jgi:PEP-CTERM motif
MQREYTITEGPTMRTRSLISASLLITAVLGGQSASASVISVGVAAFGPGSTLTTFTGVADGTEVNGLTIDGILFQYSLGNGAVLIDGGPGVTNNISPPNIVSVGNNTGVLTLTLPSFVDTFGYGFAVLSTVALPVGTTISLFDGVTPVGSLSYAAAPDPIFAGGFAGIQSTLPFNRVQLTFNSANAPAFAVDNIRTANSVVPEPASLLLLGAGLSALGASARRRTHSRR